MSGGGFVPDPSWPTIVELAIEVWGQPNRALSSKTELRFGHNGSKSVKPKEQVWHDHEANVGGGYKELSIAARGAFPPFLGTKKPYTNGHAGGMAHAGMAQDRAPRAGAPFKGPPPWEDIGVVYHYRDAQGALVLDVIRTLSRTPRKFVQRRPDPAAKSGWRWSTRDIPKGERPLYRLPELIGSGEATVWITEGEKDSDNLAALGLTATTSLGGAGKWRREYNGYFAGRDVVVLPDNDPQATHDGTGLPLWHDDGRPVLPGQDHAATVAQALVGIARSVRVLMLPDLPPKGDVTDWLAAGGTVDELEQLAREAPAWEPPPPPPGPPPGPPPDAGEPIDGLPPEPPVPEDGDGGGGDELPTIICEDGEIVRMVREAEMYLFNDPRLAIYQRGQLVQPYENEYRDAADNVTHSASFLPMTSSALMKLMARSAVYLKWDGRLNSGRGGYKKIRPPDKLVETVLYDRVDWPFDTVRGVLSCPTMRPDGSLLLDPGYDPATRYYLLFPSNLVLPEIPDQPTMEDARASLARLLALLDSYPFVNKPSRAAALCILMTQVLRCAMPVSPLLAVSAKAPGTGKSHLVDLASMIAIGRACPSMGAGKDEKETEKEINTMLLSGVPGFSIDNVSRDVESDLLNRATSQTHLTIRVYGKLEQIEVENAVAIFMTGNNLAIINEQRRRTPRCEMDAGLENPERREFVGDPIKIVLADRGRYIADVLTIARAYHVSGENVSPYPYNGFESWSHFVREPLIWLGQADAVDTTEMTAKDDPSTIRLHAMVEGWWGIFRTEAYTVAKAVNEANLKNDSSDFYQVLKEQFPGRGGEVDTMRMGFWLRKFSGRVVTMKIENTSQGMRFIRDDGGTGGSVRWKIQYV